MTRIPAGATLSTVLIPVLFLPALLAGQEAGPPAQRPYGAFAFQDSAQVAPPPREAFDRFLEVDAWWDHRFSESPSRFFIDARPGGGFYEIFDTSGDGVQHAAVIYVARGEVLRMRGPLGLSGFALDLVFTLSFRPSETGSLVHLDVRGAGELEDEWPEVVQSVWHHFLAERYQPYANGTLH